MKFYEISEFTISFLRHYRVRPNYETTNLNGASPRDRYNGRARFVLRALLYFGSFQVTAILQQNHVLAGSSCSQKFTRRLVLYQKKYPHFFFFLFLQFHFFNLHVARSGVRRWVRPDVRIAAILARSANDNNNNKTSSHYKDF